MLPNPAKKGSETRAGRAESLLDAADLSVFSAGSASASFAVATRLRSDVEGTVGAAVAPAGDQTYDAGSGALLNGLPLRPTIRPEASQTLRAGLIAELREISGQVNRMMAQVDRAIHRLGEHAGPSLRR